jgi:hypothetical protein
MIYIGIDPGVNGGLARFHDGTLVGFTPMPATERDIWGWFEFIKGLEATAVIEKIHPAILGIGKSQMSTLYGNYMQLRGFLIAAGIRFEAVRPQEWMRGVGVPPRSKNESDKEWKDRLRARAQELFPKLSIWTELKSLGRQRAICDALLIAEFCRRRACSKPS